jgi:hypothetical protein
VAVGGSARGAIDTNRLFAANTTNLPILWLFSNKEEEPLGKKLESAGLNLEWREPTAAKPSEIFDWLAAHERDPFPTMADCETGSPLFTHCYWVGVERGPGSWPVWLQSSRARSWRGGGFAARQI